MPMYEYHCEACQEVTSVLRPMAQADAPIACEHCKSTRTSRQLSVFSAAGAAASGSSSPVMAGGGCCPCGKNQGSCGRN